MTTPPLPQTVTIQLDVATAEDLFIAHAVALLVSTLLNNTICKALTLLEVSECFVDGTFTEAMIDSVLVKTKALAEAGDTRERAR